MDHGVNPFTVRVTEDVEAILRKLEGSENTGAQSVVQIMIQVGNAVRTADTFRLHSSRFSPA